MFFRHRTARYICIKCLSALQFDIVKKIRFHRNQDIFLPGASSRPPPAGGRSRGGGCRATSPDARGTEGQKCPLKCAIEVINVIFSSLKLTTGWLTAAPSIWSRWNNLHPSLLASAGVRSGTSWSRTRLRPDGQRNLLFTLR